MYNIVRSGIIISFSATKMHGWIKDSFSTIWLHQLMLSKSKTKFCIGEYFRVVSLKLRSTILTSNEESTKDTKKRKYWKRNSEKVAMNFSTDLMKKHLGNTCTQSQNLLCFLQTDPDEKQISMKIKVQAHSPSTSEQSGILVLNRYSITNWKRVFRLPIYPKHFFFFRLFRFL